MRPIHSFLVYKELARVGARSARRRSQGFRAATLRWVSSLMPLLLPDDALLSTWMKMAQTHVPIQGLPARTCWLALGERDRVGLMFNDMVERGELEQGPGDHARPDVGGRDLGRGDAADVEQGGAEGRGA